jgi:hypothetical protein
MTDDVFHVRSLILAVTHFDIFHVYPAADTTESRLGYGWIVINARLNQRPKDWFKRVGYAHKTQVGRVDAVGRSLASVFRQRLEQLTTPTNCPAAAKDIHCDRLRQIQAIFVSQQVYIIRSA